MMAGPLHRLTAKLYDTPHIVTQAALDNIFSVLEDRNTKVELANRLGAKKEIVNEEAIIKGEYESKELTIKDGVASLDLRGTTVFQETAIDAFCGLVSYQGLDRSIDSIIARKDEVNLITAFIDSPGGEAYRAFEMGSQVKAKLKEAGIKSVAYVDGMAASGGYVIAAAFDEVVANPDSQVGSIGVRIAYRNPTEEDKSRVSYITAGKNKVPFDENGDFTQVFKDKLQAGVNETYDNFVDYVADTRDMTREAVINTDADTFSANKALSLGLVDKVMTGAEFVDYIATLKEQASGGITLQSASTKNSRIEDDSVDVSTKEIIDENLNVKELSFDEKELNGDEMSDKELSQFEAYKAEMDAKLEALASADAEKDAQLATLIAEKEAQDKIAAEQLAAKQAEVDAQELATISEFVTGLSFKGDEVESEALITALHSNREVSGFNEVINAFSRAKVAVDAFDAPVAIEAPESSEEVSQKDADKAGLMAAIKATKKAKPTLY
jgi:signal peptide peptidase SppA